MPGDIKHLPVNWIDGMKISRKHFEQTGFYTEKLGRDVSALHLTDYNFGILPVEGSLDLSVFFDSAQLINIELKSCNAITPNGSRIQIGSEDIHRLSINFKEISARYNLQLSQAQQLFILVTINPFERLPAGPPIMEENPPRHPFTKPEIRLDLLPGEQLNTTQLSGSLIIGRITYQNGELQFSTDFIPPCTSVSSLPILADWFSKFRQSLDSWELSCLKVVQKINSKTQSQQPNILANNIQKISEKMLEQLVKQKIGYQWILGKSAPVYLCISLLENIQFVHTMLQCFAEKDREEMLNYFAEWTETTAGTLENQTLRVLQLNYNHYDSGSLLDEIYRCYLAYVLIFQKLAQLEFIGKKKGQSIFVIEQEVKETKNTPQNPVQKSNNRWSPLT
ncbi:MAG TPA: hypothetical protein VK625_11310 [Flavitalea sp.]|nr:hypothetical protein [Flavitalea sp.]